MPAETITQTLLDKDFASLKNNIMKVVDQKLIKKVEEKKQVVLDKLNGK